MCEDKKKEAEGDSFGVVVEAAVKMSCFVVNVVHTFKRLFAVGACGTCDKSANFSVTLLCACA